MKNPYQKDKVEDEVALSRGFLMAGTVAFCLFLVVIPGISVSSLDTGLLKAKKDEPLRELLRSIETSFSSAPVFENWRRADQARLVNWFREGNAKVVIGHKGVLHYRADIDAVIGKGPEYVEPPSVARAPGLSPWKAPLPVIEGFAAQLQERGIELVLVPVPTKSMLTSLRGEIQKRVPTSWETMKEDLSKSGITFVDLLPVFDDPDSFLKQDTHWTSCAMREAAAFLAEELSLPKGSLKTELRELERESQGDLVGMLDLPKSVLSYSPEAQILEQVVDLEADTPVESDAASPRVILGDSFVNIFEDPSLGFDVPNEERIGAGFASHLAAETGHRFHVIALNGDGASGVRKAFASLPADVVSEKKKVIWILSARDLLLAEIPGRRAGIKWEPVTFNTQMVPREVSTDAIVVTGVLRDRSAVGDPDQTPYDSAVYSVLLDALEVEKGEYEESEAYVFLRAFRERKLTASAKVEPGRRYRVILKPFPTEGVDSRATQLDDLFRTDLPRFFADSIELVE